MITTAMVMAAGHGVRMRPLTDNTCKALVKVGGKALIDHTLDRLHAAGIKRAVVNVHTFADKLEAHLKTRTSGPEVIISDERSALLETGGGVVKALPLLGNDPVLICNIDAIWIEFEPVLLSMIAAWDPKKMDELFLLAPQENAVGYGGAGDFEMQNNGSLLRRQTAAAPYVFAGVEIFKPALALPFAEKKFSRNKIWDDTLLRQKIFGYILQGFWMHVGSPEAIHPSEIILAQAK